MANLNNLPDDITKDDFLGNALSAFSFALSDKIEAVWMKTTGRGSTSCYAINQIGSEPGSSIKELTGMLSLEHSSLVRLLDGLERSGLIERRLDPNDKRGKRIYLSPEGEDMLTEMFNARRRILQVMTGQLNEEEMQQLVDLVQKMTPHIVQGGDDQHYVCRVCELEMCPQEFCVVNCSHEEWKDDPGEGFFRPTGSRRKQSNENSPCGT